MRTLLVAFLVMSTDLANAQGTPGAQAPRPAMVLTIAAWPDGGQIPLKFTQAGEQVSPELKWTNVPPGTQSFVVNMLDPDVAIQRGTETQPHWIVWNIPAIGDRPARRREARRRASPTECGRSARPVRSTAALARRRADRCTTTRSRSTRSMPRSTCHRRRARLRSGGGRDTLGRHEGHAGARTRQGGIRRLVPEAPVASGLSSLRPQ